jgi:hypothetical protein
LTLVGAACWSLEVLNAWLCKNVFASNQLFSDHGFSRGDSAAATRENAS